jgi:arginine N-succinyltransferase
MIIIRPVAMTDLDQLEELAGLAGVGLTTLPKDKKFLRKRIKSSQLGFENLIEHPEGPAGEIYLFVMEDLDSKKVIGTSALYSKVGGFEPFYSYNIEKDVFRSEQINISKEVPILKLHEEHNGPSEVGSLFVHPDYRRGGNGRFMSLIRFLFVAEHPHFFESTIISEIRGVIDEKDNSPFWDAIGRHFFGIDFKQADYLSVVNKRFIAELMPDHPIYITMLPKSAQDVIGVCHEQSKPAMKTLEDEGFRYENKVDIFDAGPLMSCRCDQIRTVRKSRRANVKIVDEVIAGEPSIFCTTNERFVSVCTPLREKGDEVEISRQVADALQLNAGEMLRYIELRPAK